MQSCPTQTRCLLPSGTRRGRIHIQLTTLQLDVWQVGTQPVDYPYSILHMHALPPPHFTTYSPGAMPRVSSRSFLSWHGSRWHVPHMPRRHFRPAAGGNQSQATCSATQSVAVLPKSPLTPSRQLQASPATTHHLINLITPLLILQISWPYYNDRVRSPNWHISSVI